MWPEQALNPGPLTYESGALPIALRGPAVYRMPGKKKVFIAIVSSETSIAYTQVHSI